jgi:hypothetical protein
MKQTVHACFGHVLFRNECDDGEFINVQIYTTSNNTLFAVQGHETRNGIRTFGAGDMVKSNKEIPAETYPAVMQDNYTVWCYSPHWNKGQDPELEKLILDGGAETLLPIDTKLFLCSGTLQVGGKNLTAPQQIRIKTKQQLVTAIDPCYGLIFP